MAKFAVCKLPNNLLSHVDDDGYDILKKIKIGEIYENEIKKPRNYKFHRKFFALLKLVFENQDKYDNIKDLRVEIELKTGNYEEHLTLKGKIIYIPKSISFDKMDDIEFEKLYNKSIDIILSDFIKGGSKKEIEKQVNKILGFL